MATQDKTGFAGLLQNVGQAMFGEEEGMKLTSGPITRPQVAAAKEANRKKKEQDAAREAAKAAAGAKKTADDFAAGGQRESQRQMAAQQKSESALSGELDDLAQKVKWQEMVNDGKEREVEIEQALARAQGLAKRDLTDAERERITASAGSLFDLSNKPLREGEVDASYREQGPGATALEKIGAVMGGAGKDSAKPLNDIRTQSVKTVQWLQKIYEKTGDASLGEV